MSKKKKKNKSKCKFGCDIPFNGDSRTSNKSSKRLRKQLGGLTPIELNILCGRMQLCKKKATVVRTTNIQCSYYS